MAVNPTAPLGAPELTEDPGLFPDQLTEGVERTKNFYAYVRRAPDGTEHWEWYKRGTQSGVLGIGRGPDPILTTQVVPPRAARENKTPTLRNINGLIAAETTLTEWTSDVGK